MTTADLVLPRGRHGLTREQVRAVQRRRLLRAAVQEVADRGYASLTAARVYGRAGVSSKAFYENFRDVSDCFLAAYDTCSDLTASALTAVAERDDGPPLARFEAVVRTYLGLLAAEPAVARTFLVEVYAAGPQAVARRLAVHERFVAVAQHLLRTDDALEADDRAAVAGLVDAVTFAVTLRVAAGDLRDTDALIDDLLLLARRLCPWLDPKVAP